jgi:membrane protease YdiL (CAAX protease family)
MIVFIILNVQPYGGNPDDAGREAKENPVDLREAEQAAERFLREAVLPDGWNVFAYFQSNTDLAGYLYENGLMDEYMETFGELIPVDYFQVEAVHRRTGAVYLVDVHPGSGRVAAYRQVSADSAAPGTPNHPEEKELSGGGRQPDDEKRALQFLNTRGFDPAALRLANPGEKDGELLFVHEKSAVGEARLLVSVRMENGGVVSFEPVFSLPDTYWKRQDRREASQALASLLSLLLSAVLGIAAVVRTAALRGSIDFRRGIVVTIIYVAIAIHYNYNSLPGYKAMAAEGLMAGELSAVAAASEIRFNIMFANIFAMATGVVMYLSLVSGDAAWRLTGRQPWARWKEPDYGDRLKAAVNNGYAWGLFLLGAQSAVFWILDRMFGIWATNDPIYSPFNLLFPALFPLMAWAAALSEEAIYRLFAIRFLENMLRSRAAAVILSSMIWAVAHLGYPVYPPYTRFVEVTLLGLVLGWVFLRYGFITAVFAHAVVDCVLMGLSLFEFGNPELMMIGILYMLSPAAAGWLIARLHDRLGPRIPPSPAPPPAP